MFRKKNKKKIHVDVLNEKLNSLRIPLSLVTTPINLEEERVKFMASEKYNPRFRYRVVKNKNDNIFKELEQVEDVDGVDPSISEFYINLIKDKKLANELMNSVGKNELFTNYAIQKFSMPSSILFRNSCRVMRGNMKNYKVVDMKNKDDKYLDLGGVQKIFKGVFEEFGLGEWGVAASKNIRKNGVKVGIKGKVVYVDPNIQKTLMAVKKTVVHEMTHIFRSHNGLLSGVEALSKPNLSEYLDVEEGFAMWNEEYMGYLKEEDLKERASVVYAIYLGKELSFRDLYNVMFGVYPRQKAFYLTYLVKRGLGDTSLPGIYTRSAAYFRGFRRVRKKIELDASLFEKLYAGKIGFKQVKWVDDGLIREASIVPSKQSFEKVFKNFQ